MGQGKESKRKFKNVLQQMKMETQHTKTHGIATKKRDLKEWEKQE
jgi:hypothetical protein